MIVLYGVLALWTASAALCVISLCLAARKAMPEDVEARNIVSISHEQREFVPQTSFTHSISVPALANAKGST